MQLPNPNQSFISQPLVEGGIIYNQLPIHQVEPEALLTHGASSLPPKNNTRPLDPQFKAGINSSPKAPAKYGSNSRSFTCLLKEIDEEEEKNFKASMPQETERFPRGSNNEKTQREAEGQTRKSRNGNVPKLNSTNGLNKKPSSASLASSNKVQQQSQHSSQTKFSVVKESSASSVQSLAKSKSGSSLRPSLSKSKSKNSLKEKSGNNKITNEIKDLLDKLVTY